MIDSLIYITGLLVWIGCIFWFLFYVLVEWCNKLWKLIRPHLWIWQIQQLYSLRKTIKEQEWENYNNTDWDYVKALISAYLSNDEKYSNLNRSIVRKYALKELLDLYFKSTVL